MKEYKIKINGNEYAVAIEKMEDNQAAVSVNGNEYKVEVEGMAAPKRAVRPAVAAAAAPVANSVPVSKVEAPRATGTVGDIKSPLPGVLLDVMVHEGDTVKVGQRLMVLEAMKMENNIDSDREGVVRALKVRKGDSVLEGDVLISIG